MAKPYQIGFPPIIYLAFSGRTAITPYLLSLWSYAARHKATALSTELFPFLKFRLSEHLNILSEKLKQADTQENASAMYEACRELYYYLIIFGSIFRVPVTKKLIARLNNLLCVFEFWQNLHLSPLLLNKLIRSSAPRIAHRDVGLIIGWQTHKARALPEKLIKQKKLFKKLLRQWLVYYNIR